MIRAIIIVFFAKILKMNKTAKFTLNLVVTTANFSTNLAVTTAKFKKSRKENTKKGLLFRDTNLHTLLKKP